MDLGRNAQTALEVENGRIDSQKKNKNGVGKFCIADHWNAISIIAGSQANPFKAVAEFVENSIDARARQITVVRGKRKGEFYRTAG